MDEHTDVPTLLPARMLNEYAYCPRLFFLEWVQKQFVDNAETTEGRYVHRVVDQASGVDALHTRSLLLSCDALGLIAKVDLVETDETGVRPVDYKRGSPPRVPEHAYEPERVQLCAQGLLLRSAGHTCESGILYFAGARTRIDVPFTPDLVDRTLGLIREARTAAAKTEAPPPLLDSPKCPRCSLVGICLPDEVATLRERGHGQPRRLMPTDPASAPLYVTEQGAYVGSRGGRIEVRKDGARLSSVRDIDVSQVAVFGNVQVSAQAFRKLFARDVPICFFSYGGWFTGIAHGHPSKHVTLRMRQVIAAGRQDAAPGRAFVKGKIQNARTLLRRNGRPRPEQALRQLKRLAGRVDSVRSTAELLGVEGTAASVYFGSFTSMLKTDGSSGLVFDMHGRNRRPPLDPVNCLLSFVYGLIVKDLTAVLLAVGFDPYVGLYHKPRFGRPALSLDLAEEFRPLLGDSVVIAAINNGEVGLSDFDVRPTGVQLTASGRKSVIRAYERRLRIELRHPVFGYRVSYRRLLELQARLLGAYLLGEVPDYQPIVTR